MSPAQDMSPKSKSMRISAQKLTKLALCLILASQASGAAAVELKGKAEQSGTPTILQGGVKDESPLNSSLKVFPGSTLNKQTPTFAPNSPNGLQPSPLNIQQFSGNQHFANGQRVNDRVPQSAHTVFQQPHVIPPISSYIRTPRNGVMSWVPGYGASVTSTQTQSSYSVPGHQVYSATHNGVTSYAPGYAVSQMSSKTGITSHPAVSVFASHGGITTYAPGYSVTEVKTDSIANHGGNTGLSPIESRNGISSWMPGHSVAIATSRNGVVCWDNSKQVTVSTPGVIKTTLGGLWYTPTQTTALRGTPGKLFPTPMFCEPVVGPMDRPLVATGLLMPQFQRAGMDGNISWDQWYKSVGRSIYDAWQNADVGPGIATVRVTVTKDRDLSCQVVDFAPAPYVSRDIPLETNFRETAVRCVNLVSKYEIPEFPKASTLKQVTFDVEMKRTVDGTSGFGLASATEALKFPSSQASATETPAASAESVTSKETMQETKAESDSSRLTSDRKKPSYSDDE